MKLLTTLLSLAALTSPWPTSKTPVNIGKQLPAGFEPSGSFYNPFDRSLNVIHDEAKLARMQNVRGSIITEIRDITSPWGSDIEGITSNNSRLLYIGIEMGIDSMPVVAEFDPTSLAGYTGRFWNLQMPTRRFGHDRQDAVDGMEGLTLIRDGEHPWGFARRGEESFVFLGSSQVNGTIYVYRPTQGYTRSSLGPVAQFRPALDRVDISDLHYSSSQKTLYVLYDEDHKLVLMDLSQNILNEFELPEGKDYEGFGLIENCPGAHAQAILAADNKKHPVFVFSGFPIRCPESISNI